MGRKSEYGKFLIKMEMNNILHSRKRELEHYAMMEQLVAQLEEVHVLGMEELPSGFTKM